MQVELWPIERVKPYDRNPRLNDQAVDAVAASLKEFGWRQPVVVDAEGVIVVGHTRWKAAKKLGLVKVPVHVAKDVTPEQAKAYRLADNQTATIAEWDKELLPLELADLKDANFDLGLLGFSQDELAKWLQLGQLLNVTVLPNPYDVGYWSFYAGQSEPNRAFPEAYDPAVHAGWLQAAVESQR